MSSDEINHALAALDQARELIKAGAVDAWMLITVPVTDGFAPCGWAANTPIAMERLGFRLVVLSSEINRQAWTQLLPQPSETSNG